MPSYISTFFYLFTDGKGLSSYKPGRQRSLLPGLRSSEAQRSLRKGNILGVCTCVRMHACVSMTEK